MEELNWLVGSRVTDGQVLLAHLGHGAKLVVVHHGRSRDITISFSLVGGLLYAHGGDAAAGGLVLGQPFFARFYHFPGTGDGPDLFHRLRNRARRGRPDAADAGLTLALLVVTLLGLAA